MTLTPKQEAFAHAYVETGNASEAYRRSYGAEHWTENALNVQASKMLKHPKIVLRLDEIQAKAAKKHEITVDSLVTELEEARVAAMGNPRGISAAVSATMGKAKLLGLVVDKAETTGPNGGPMQVHNRIEYAIVDTKG
jgi:phage terminase small subunit